MILDIEYCDTLPLGNQNNMKRRFKCLESECLEKHNNKYSYHNAVYRGMAHKFTVTCDVHGDYEQTPDQHLKAGYGCRKCADENNKKYITKSDFVAKAIDIHGERYDYSLLPERILKSEKQSIICVKHGEFKTTHYSHTVTNTGCRKCAQEYHDIDFRRRYFDTPTVLYYVKLTTKDNTVYYKIGITNRFKENGDVSKRFKSEEVKVETLYYELYESGLPAYEKEQLLLKQYKQFIIPNNVLVLKNGGNSEVLSEHCWLFDVNPSDNYASLLNTAEGVINEII